MSSYFKDFWEPDPADLDEDGQHELVSCRFCGKGGLHWEQEEEDHGPRWVLLDGRYKVHRCDMQRAAYDDFDAI